MQPGLHPLRSTGYSTAPCHGIGLFLSAFSTDADQPNLRGDSGPLRHERRGRKGPHVMMRSDAACRAILDGVSFYRNGKHQPQRHVIYTMSIDPR